MHYFIISFGKIHIILMDHFKLLGESANLQVLDNVDVGSSPCIGDNITYVCNITSNIHVWNVYGTFTGRTLGPNTPPQMEEGYNLRVMSVDNNDNIMSSLSLKLAEKHIGTSIVCIDGVNTSIIQESMAMALSEYNYYYFDTR